jgi:hypothetical protein
VGGRDRRHARARHARAVVAPDGAETQLAFAALIDLCDELDTEGLAVPQRWALDVALLRVRPGGTPPEPHAIALGFLNLLRRLAEREPVLVAIDDVQWLDEPSAGVLSFAARRIAGERVAFLLARRPGRGETPLASIHRSLARSVVKTRGGAAVWLERRPAAFGPGERPLNGRSGVVNVRWRSAVSWPDSRRVCEVVIGWRCRRQAAAGCARMRASARMKSCCQGQRAGR